MPQLSLKTLTASAVIVVCALLLAFLSAYAVTRPLWIDEAMAMVNYPLSSVRALFEPLPLYSQAAPPFFNLICSVLVGFDPAVGRGILLAAIVLSVVGSVAVVYRDVIAVAAALLAVVALPDLIPMASEFKYYGLEMVGMAVTLAWLLRKDPAEPISLSDVVVLACAILLGISTLVFVPLALATILVLRWRTSFVLHLREMVFLLGFLALMLVYYLCVRHATSIQIGTYTDVYQQGGIRSVARFFRFILLNSGLFFLPFLLIAAVVTALNWRDERSIRLITYGALVSIVFSGLILIGLYPLSATRHVIWINGILVFIAANGAFLMMRSPLRGTWGSRVATAGIVACIVAALLGPARTLTSAHGFMHTDNDSAIAFLLDNPGQPVGIWSNGQPIIELYEKRFPALRQMRFFGVVNNESRPLPAWLAGLDVANASYPEVSSRLEGASNEPGAWGRMNFYRSRLDYSAPAAHFVAEAPKSTPFLVFTSHSDYNTQEPFEKARVVALLGALDAAHCQRELAATGLRFFILRATCP